MPTTTTQSPSTLKAVMERARQQVDSALDRYLPAVEPEGQSACPARLAEAMRYSVQAGGKRLRPVLALLAAKACGASEADAMASACALEMVHTYSLIHDDLPAMDDDDLRRGRPTCHKAFDEATAILAGDALLTLAFEIVAKDTHPAPAAVRCIQILAEASGPMGMVGGQMADLEAEGRTDGTVERLEAIHRRKTGALLMAPLCMGAAVAQASVEVTQGLERYGRSIGLAFQIIDDLLDVQGDEAKLGKRAQKDSDLGKWTYPGLLGIQASRDKAQALAEDAVKALAPLGEKAAVLRDLAWTLLERDR